MQLHAFPWAAGRFGHVLILPQAESGPPKLFQNFHRSSKSNSITHHHNLLTTGHSRRLTTKLSATGSSCLFFFSRLPLATPAAGSAFTASARPFAPARRVVQLYTQTPLRTYASSKKKKMPPKKEVKQEKVLLGRPGNSLKSGIVCNAEMCVLCACCVFSANDVSRSVSPM